MKSSVPIHGTAALTQGIPRPLGRPAIPDGYAASISDNVIAFNAIIEYNAGIWQTATPMAMLTIRNIDQAVKERLRIRAAEHGHSMEAEARRILQTALSKEASRSSGRSFAERIHARFAALGGVDLQLPPREPVREPPAFE
jgi:plasmid stability protein